MKKIVVFGSYVTDLTSRAPSLPRPGETVFSDQFVMGPGGKGSNQAVAAHRAGGDIILVTKVGTDLFAENALAFYQAEKMNTEWVLKDDQHPTGVALIGVDEKSGQNQIIVCPGACMHITEEDIERMEPLIESADILLVQLEVNLDALESVIKRARPDAKIILNPAPYRPLPDAVWSRCTCVTPNETEAEHFTGIPVTDAQSAAKAAEKFHEKGIPNVIITMGEKGVFVSGSEGQTLIPATSVPVVDTTGAGDAFSGCFATAVAEGKTIPEAARFANIAAGLSVGKQGTAPAMPQREEIDELSRKLG